MANFSTFIPIALFVALCLALFKIQRLNTALAVQQADNVEITKQMEKAVGRNIVLEERLKKEVQDRGGVELKFRDCWKEKDQIKQQMDQNKRLAADTSTQLQYKIQENFALTKQVEEAREQVVVKQREVDKAAEEAIRYRDLFEAGNRKVDDVREAYVKLKQQVDAGLVKPSGMKVNELKGGHSGNVAESVVRRDAAEGEDTKVEGRNDVDEVHKETGKAQEEQNRVESPRDEKPSGQEPPLQQEERKKDDDAAQEADEKEEAAEAKAEEGKDREQREATVDEEMQDEEEKDEREPPVIGEERKIEEEEEEEEEGEGEGGNKGQDRAKRNMMMDKLKKMSDRKTA